MSTAVTDEKLERARKQLFSLDEKRAEELTDYLLDRLREVGVHPDTRASEKLWEWVRDYAR